MLIRFSVSNFLSFEKKQNLSLEAGKSRKHPERVYTNRRIRLVKCQTLFGANGSGKSNLVESLLFFQTIVTKGFPRGFSNSYYRLSEENRSLPSEFELEMICEDKHLCYGFTTILYTGSIIKEWLYEITPSGLQKYMYQRDTNEELFTVGKYFKQNKTVSRLKNYGEDSSNDTETLFLSIISKNMRKMYDDHPEMKILRSVYKLISKLTISRPGSMLTGYTLSPHSNLDEIANILNALGTGITHIKYVDISPEIAKNNIPEEVYNDIIAGLEKENARIKKEGNKISPSIIARSFKQFYTFTMDPSSKLSIKTIEFEHESKDIFFKLIEESDGTARLLDLIEILLEISDNRIYIIDEIDRCLHPALTTRMIKTFLKMANDRNTQLIITAHESRLLKDDLLRNDEISFMLKTQNGSTIIKHLDQYKIRADKSIYEAMFDGTFESLPRFNDEILNRIAHCDS